MFSCSLCCNAKKFASSIVIIIKCYFVILSFPVFYSVCYVDVYGPMSGSEALPGSG